MQLSRTSTSYSALVAFVLFWGLITSCSKESSQPKPSNNNPTTTHTVAIPKYDKLAAIQYNYSGTYFRCEGYTNEHIDTIVAPATAVLLQTIDSMFVTLKPDGLAELPYAFPATGPGYVCYIYGYTLCYRYQ